MVAVMSQRTVRTAAIVVSVGFVGLAVFQAALAAGAPLGAAAWGGAERVLSTGPRIGSAIAAVLYLLGAFSVLRCAAFKVRWVPAKFARVTTWIFAVILQLSAVANVASESEWERYLLAPIGLLLGVLCLVVARHTRPGQQARVLPASNGRLAASP
ncbi:MAG: hypothetical protein ACJ76A_07625 [Actinomycetota bacterium]